MRTSLLLRIGTISLVSCLLSGSAARSSPLADIRELLGTWSGSGVYDGNELRLTRTWSPELGAEVVRSDMTVDMPNGFAFRSTALWHASGDGYAVFLMDEGGRFELLAATVDAATGEVVLEFLDPHADDPPGKRRWVYRTTGPDTYTEILEKPEGDGWSRLAEYTFHRTTPSNRR